VTPRRRFPRVGVLGGSFDPVHLGHLILAEAAIDHLRLDELILMPARQPAHKLRRRLAPVQDRLAMLRLAIRGNPKLTISRIECDGPGVAYTHQTLERLTASRKAEWYFLMGGDSLREFAGWREPGRILELARLAVVPRAEGGSKAVSGPPTLRAALRRRMVTVPMPQVGISASEIRSRVRRGGSVRYWVPDSVLAYLNRHGLYRNTRTGRT
jgi:nicotinate-nucleotide adenylyltransferase